MFFFSWYVSEHIYFVFCEKSVYILANILYYFAKTLYILGRLVLYDMTYKYVSLSLTFFIWVFMYFLFYFDILSLGFFSFFGSQVY